MQFHSTITIAGLIFALAANGNPNLRKNWPKQKIAKRDIPSICEVPSQTSVPTSDYIGDTSTYEEYTQTIV